MSLLFVNTLERGEEDNGSIGWRTITYIHHFNNHELHLQSLGHDEESEGEAEADDEDTRHHQLNQQPGVQRQCGLKYFYIFKNIWNIFSSHPRVVEGLYRSVMPENIVQSEFSLDVSDGGDDVDDVVIVHLQGNIVT